MTSELLAAREILSGSRALGGENVPPPTLNRVSNELPSKLVICGDGERRFILAPLELRSLTNDDWRSFGPGLRTLADWRVVSLSADTGLQTQDALWILFGLGVWVLPAYLIAGIFFSSLWYWLAGLFVGLLLVPAFLIGRRSTLSLQRLLWPLVVVLAVGIITPAAAVYFGGHVNKAVDDFRQHGGSDVIYLTLIGRILQTVLISVASLFPALLYFLFDRMKVETLRQNFVRDIFRLDPTVSTVSDVRARYGALLDELVGPDGATATPPTQQPTDAPANEEAASREPWPDGKAVSRLRPDRRAPVWVATIVITLGWILALLNPDTKTLAKTADILLIFEPQRSPVVFAFLGAYIFTLQALLRSYLRADLRPKSYSHVTVRILVAVTFAWVLELLFLAGSSPVKNDDPLLVLAFVVGFLPDTLLVRLQESVRHLAGSVSLPKLYERYPLTKLEGIDIYDRSRLLEEGVGNIEGLAHHNLPELMMQTRIPVGRLVHWTDQAILFLHVATTIDVPDGDSTTADPERRLRLLQEYGIHTATDLLNAYDAAAERAQKTAERPDAEPEPTAFLSLLGAENSIYRLQIILDAIKDEEWMSNLTYWHDERHHTPKTLTLTNGKLEQSTDPAVGASTEAHPPSPHTRTRLRAQEQ